MTSFDDYRALEAVNWSSLKRMAESPRHYAYGLTHDRPDTAAMAFGRAAHCATLEPDEFPLRYVLWDGGIRRGKAWDAFLDVTSAAKEVLPAEDYRRCLAIRDAVHAHPVAARLLRDCKFETTVEWTDPGTGIACKCRPDAVKKATLVDLKTARTIDARKFGRNAYDLGYFGQLAWYAEGLAITSGVGDFEAYIVAVEADQPHDVGVFQITAESLYAAGVKAHELLDRVAECTTSGAWPGRYEDTQDLALPVWEFVEDNNEELVISGLKSAEGFV